MNWRASAFICLGAVFLAVSAAEGAMVYVQIPESEQQFFGLGEIQTRDFDFDHDGRQDVRFAVGATGFAVRSLHSEAGILTASMVGGGFFGQTAVPLLYGELIEHYTELPFGESRGITPGLDSGNSNIYLLSYGALDGNAGGIWFNREAYMGFALYDPIVEGEFAKYHYGWLRLREFGGLGAFFLEYAYETETDVPVFAGQVPEPSGFILGLGGACLFTQRRRRQ